MTASKGWFVPGILLSLGVVFSGIGGGLLYLRHLHKAEAGLAADTATLELPVALVRNGPAWVKVRLDYANPALRLTCHTREAVWKTHESKRQETKSEYRGGKWEKTTKVWIERTPPETVPVRMTGEGAEVTIENWKTIRVWEDLLKVEGETTREDRGERERDLYVPAGAEVWLYADFQQGEPVPVVNGMMVLSAGGREKYVADLGEQGFFLTVMACIFGGIGLLLGGIGGAVLVAQFRKTPRAGGSGEPAQKVF
jgi:hypothetical protein